MNTPRDPDARVTMIGPAGKVVITMKDLERYRRRGYVTEGEALKREALKRAPLPPRNAEGD